MRRLAVLIALAAGLLSGACGAVRTRPVLESSIGRLEFSSPRVERAIEVESIEASALPVLELAQAPSNVRLQAPDPVVGFTCNQTAASASLSAVQTSVNAASSGQTVCIPSGTATWAGNLSVSSGITIRGQANCTLDGNSRPTSCPTNIRVGVTGSRLITWSVPTNGAARLSNLKIDDNSGSCSNSCIEFDELSNMAGTGHVRVDHMIFDHLPDEHIRIIGARGVYDHNVCTFNSTARCGTIYGAFPADSSNVPWTVAAGFGGADWFVVEDSSGAKDDSGNNDHYSYFDGFAGARYVGRYNTMSRLWWEMHGTDSSGSNRGTRAVEIYRNTMNSSACSSTCDPIVDFRSGSGIIFDNTVTGAGWGGTIQITLAIYRLGTSFAFWLDANGSRAWDQNSGGSLQKAIDQPCVGSGGRVDTSGASPSVPWAAGANDQLRTSQSGGDGCWEWNNLLNGSTDIDFNNGSSTPYVVSGTDFYNDISTGLRSARPATCSLGQAYWSTDGGTNWNTTNGSGVDGGLDKCTATNTWTNDYYVPRCYPDPWTSGGVCGGSLDP